MLLELEHRRLGDVLSAIEHEADALALGRSFSADVVNQALDYLRDYPDRCHHPKEDVIAGRIREVGGEDGPAAELIAEHRALHDLTAVTTRRFRADLSEQHLAAVSQSLKSFVSSYRRHIADENAHFFPLAKRTLSQSDFDAIDFRLFDSPDPLFDAAEEARFSALIDKLIRSVPTMH